MPNIIINDIPYHYTISAATAVTAQQPPLVLLHGFTGSAVNWQPLVAACAGTYQLIAIDLLGHGQTAAPADPTRYGMAQSARDVIDLLAQVAPRPVNLLGYSMGGRLALYIAATDPYLIQTLVLESASPGLADPVARQTRLQSDEALADRIERAGMAAFVDHWETIPLFASQQSLPEATRSRVHALRLRNRELGLANSLRGLGTGVQPALWDQLATLSMPTLLLTGALDQKFCAIAEQMVTQLPTATHVTIAQAGHTIHLEQPAAFQRAILDFYASYTV